MTAMGQSHFRKAQKLLRFRGALTLSLPSKVFLNAARVAHVSVEAKKFSNFNCRDHGLLMVASGNSSF